MSRIGRREVEHIAHLARLQLREEEIASMQEQLGSILGYIEELNSVSVDGVPPTFHAVLPPGGGRPDRIEPSLERDVALSQAPEHEAGGFSVPRVLETGG